MALRTPGRERDRGENPAEPDHLPAISRDGFLAWEQPGLKIFIGWSVFTFAMLLLIGAWFFRTRPADADLPGLALMILFMAASGTTFQAGVYGFLCRLRGLFPSSLILTAVGYRAPVKLDFVENVRIGDSRTRESSLWRLELIAIPSLLLAIGALIVGAIEIWWRAPLTSETISSAAIYQSPLKIAAWTWMLQATWMLLPIPGSRGRNLLEAFGGLLAPRSTEIEVQRRANLLQGLIGISIVFLGLWAWRWESQWYDVPAWPLVVALGVLIWSGRRPLTTTGDVQRDSPSLEPTGTGKRAKPSFGKTMLGRWRIRRAMRDEHSEALDERDLDAVLEKLHRDGPQSLAADERALLTRVSRRLRSRK